LAAHAIGAVDGMERTALETHLEQCRPCRHDLFGLRAATASLIAPDTPPPALSGRITRRCQPRTA
jgi:hypothetical protein